MKYRIRNNINSFRSIVFTIYTAITIVFNIALPKGGFAMYGVPITWGYLLMIPFFLYGFLYVVTKQRITTRRIITFFFMSFFMIYFLVFLIDLESYSIGYGLLLSSVINFLVFPFVFIIFSDIYIKPIIDVDSIYHKLIIKCVYFIAIYGIVLFLYKTYTGRYFEIPYITINIKDYGKMDFKFNNRGGGVFKLISTYNNGNIFGISAIFLLPFISNIRSAKLLLKTAMFLTLSRTVWLGLIVYEIINYRKKISKLLIFVPLGLLIVILILLVVLEKDSSFIFDLTLNGRINSESFKELAVWYSDDFGGLSEIIYLGVLKNLGLIGLIFFIVYWVSPLLLSSLSKNRFNLFQKKMSYSVMSYIIICFIDSAYSWIPVGLFFWIANSILLIRNKN